MAGNHESYLDPVAVGVACWRPLNYMAKEELFANPLTFWFMSSLNCFPVKRDSADLSALKEGLKRLKSGKPLVIFPEGSRRFDGGPNEPQPGIGFLAAKSGVPVIPAFVKGTQEALPRGDKFIHPKKVIVFFGKQILIERGMPYQRIAQLIMDNIRHLSC